MKRTYLKQNDGQMKYANGCFGWSISKEKKKQKGERKKEKTHELKK